MRQILCTSVLIVLTALATDARALSMTLLPQNQLVNTGDVVAIDVWVDFDLFIIGGGFDIAWDPNALAFESVELADIGNPAFRRTPDVFDGLLESWAFGDFAPFIGEHFVGTVFFTVLDGMGQTTDIMASDTSGIGGPWTDAFLFYTLDYHDATLTRVPLPAAGWLMLGALGTLIVRRQPRVRR